MEIGNVGSKSVNNIISSTVQSSEKNSDSSFEAKLRSAMENKDDKQLKEACQEFEGVMLGMLYKQMKATVPKSEFMEGDSSTEILQSMLDDELVNVASKRSSLGIADIMYKQLSRQYETYSNANSSTNSNDSAVSAGSAANAIPDIDAEAKDTESSSGPEADIAEIQAADETQK